MLNVTISEPIAAGVRRIASRKNSTISSVVEQALARELRWEQIRLDGLKAIDAYYQEHGYPTEEEMAEAAAQVAEEHRLIDEAHAAPAVERGRRHRDGDEAAGGPAANRRAQGTA